jgi:hypothetical protein
MVRAQLIGNADQLQARLMIWARDITLRMPVDPDDASRYRKDRGDLLPDCGPR